MFFSSACCGFHLAGSFSNINKYLFFPDAFKSMYGQNVSLILLTSHTFFDFVIKASVSIQFWAHYLTAVFPVLTEMIRLSLISSWLGDDGILGNIPTAADGLWKRKLSWQEAAAPKGRSIPWTAMSYIHLQQRSMSNTWAGKHIRRE